MKGDGVQGDSREPDICQRTLEFAVRIIRLHRVLARKGDEGRVIGRQLLKAGTSIGANVEEAQAGQSRRDFASKIAIAQKEARETVYWIRLLIAANVLPARRLTEILGEAQRIARILARILISTRRRTRASRANPD